MKKSMRKIAGLFLGTFALMAISISASAQNVITGTVTDSKDGAPAAGVTVTVKGTQIATQTGADGSYSISAPNKNATLVFTSTEFGRSEIATGGRATVNNSLVKTTQNLNEVVVIGYGTARKKDLTGSNATVTAKDFNKGAIVTPEQLIQGKVAGVSVISNSGSPGSGSVIRIRGGASLNASNNPLIVIDGVPVDEDGSVKGSPNILATINPNDIESFNILKDASSTAIYGSRASNGVILITTKKGKKGKAVVAFSSLLSVATISKKADIFESQEFRDFVNTNPAGANFIKYLGTANTDWQDVIYHDAITTDNNISVAGAAGFLPYRVSLGYLNQDGIRRKDNLERVTASVSLSPTFLKNHLRVELNLKGANSHSIWGEDGTIGASVQFDPTQPVFSGNNRYGGYYQYMAYDAISNDNGTGLRKNSPSNPLGLLEQNVHAGWGRRSVGNLLLDYKFHFLPDLKATLNLGYDIADGYDWWVSSDSAKNSYKYLAGNKNSDGIYRGGNFSSERDKYKNTVTEFYLTYAKDIKSIDSRVDVVAGHSFQDFEKTEYRDFTKFLDGTIRDGSKPRSFINKPASAIESYYARLNYILKNKYYLTASVRTDGSSKFPKENRWGVFPAVAVAWKIKEEAFLKNSSVLSDLKLRASYGITGQQAGLDNYLYQIYYNTVSSTSQYQFGNTFDTLGYTLQGYNNTIQWEQTATTNIGLDFGFFNNRITGTFDIYEKKTTDLINEVDLPGGSNPANKIKANVGSMTNRGAELGINARAIQQKDLSWDLGFNITYNQNKITRLTFNADPSNPGNRYNSGASLPGTGANLFIHSLNYLRGSFYVYQQVYDNATGKPIEDFFVDRNRDGVINENDLYQFHNADPKLFLGFNTGITYKKLFLGTSLRANVGNYVYNNIAANSGTLSRIFAVNSGVDVLQNGSRDVLNTNFKGTSDKYFLSDYYVQNASFIKMDYISLAYNVGSIFRNAARLRVSANLQNVFTITNYEGTDPELASGVDNNFYPRPRTASLGVNIEF